MHLSTVVFHSCSPSVLLPPSLPSAIFIPFFLLVSVFLFPHPSLCPHAPAPRGRKTISSTIISEYAKQNYKKVKVHQVRNLELSVGECKSHETTHLKLSVSWYHWRNSDDLQQLWLPQSWVPETVGILFYLHFQATYQCSISGNSCVNEIKELNTM